MFHHDEENWRLQLAQTCVEKPNQVRMGQVGSHLQSDSNAKVTRQPGPS